MSLVMPTTPETAGMPRLRDRIAAWLVPPPVSVTIPAIGRLPRLIAWLGRISCATRITGSSPSLDPAGCAGAWGVGAAGAWGWGGRGGAVREITARAAAVR